MFSDTVLYRQSVSTELHQIGFHRLLLFRIYNFGATFRHELPALQARPQDWWPPNLYVAKRLSAARTTYWIESEELFITT